jgi:hypothetical protein
MHAAGYRVLVVAPELASMMALGWTRLILIGEKTILEAMSTLGSMLGLKLDFEFENAAGKELGASPMSIGKDPNLILFLSSEGTDFLTGES